MDVAVLVQKLYPVEDLQAHCLDHRHTEISITVQKCVLKRWAEPLHHQAGILASLLYPVHCRHSFLLSKGVQVSHDCRL